MGSRIANGESMGGSRGIMRMVAGMFNFVTDTFGAVQTGYAIMGLAIFGAVTAAIKVWHSPNF